METHPETFEPPKCESFLMRLIFLSLYLVHPGGLLPLKEPPAVHHCHQHQHYHDGHQHYYPHHEIESYHPPGVDGCLKGGCVSA